MLWDGVKKAANDLGLKLILIVSRRRAELPWLEGSDTKRSYMRQTGMVLIESCRKALIETLRKYVHISVQQRCHECLHLLAGQADVLFVGIRCQLLTNQYVISSYQNMW